MLITAVVLIVAVMTGLVAQIGLIVEDFTHRQLPPKNPHHRDDQHAANNPQRRLIRYVKLASQRANYLPPRIPFSGITTETADWPEIGDLR